jgi:NAD(P)-dependent dehydrogenase (short-subunit alcohol dehydrogenase family)
VIAIRGPRSRIAQELIGLTRDHVVPVGRGEDMPLDCERYLFCAGLLLGKRKDQYTPAEITETMSANCWAVTDQIERIISANDLARICVIGSESGIAGSYDEIYAESKRRLHHYVETKKLRTPAQQLVCVAPAIIEDAGMTLRRTDNLDARRAAHPKKRFLLAREVARLVYFLLYRDSGCLTGITIRMNGGAHCSH